MATANIFIFDAAVSDYLTLAVALPEGSEWFVLDSSRNGIEQIAAIAANYSDLASIQIISHGAQGSLKLGNFTLNNANVNSYAGLLAQIGGSLGNNGDLLLYGCNVAQGAEGQAFINNLSQLTQADVAASTDLTGAAALGGNAVLEAATGTIESATVLSAATLDANNTLLLIPPVVTLNAPGANTFTRSGSLAILDATTVFQAVTVSGLSGALSNLTVTLTGLSYSTLSNLDFLLVAPDGKHNLVFMSDTGGNNAPSNVNLTFSDTGPALLPQSTLPTTGTYRPTDYEASENGANWDFSLPLTVNHPSTGGFGTATLASAFNGLSGTDLNGSWALYVRDDSGAGLPDGGSINSWSLGITTVPNYTELGAGVSLAPALNVTDSDSANLVSATVRIANVQIGDVLAATVTGTTITASYNAINGTLLLSGSDTLAHYKQVLDSVTFSSSSHNPTQSGLNATRTIEWQVNDGTALVPPLFGAATANAAGTTPTSVATGDLNGDGKLDLAVTNGGSNNVSILLGNGNGTFGAATNVGVGTNPQSVSIADLDGDGRLDLVVANKDSGNVTVLLNNGSGSFLSGGNLAAGLNPASVAIADLNGDGRLDITVANGGGTDNSGTVSVLLGNGNGTFAAKTDIALGFSLGSVAIADLNGDGKLDLIAPNPGLNNVSVLLGNGDGTYGAVTGVAAGLIPRSVAIADLNNDGKRDLVVGNANDSTVSILLGTGTGTFGAATNLAVGPGPVAIADLNGDGRQDIVVGGTTARVLLGNGNGTFAAAISLTGSAASGIAIGDFNGAGGLDLALANSGGASVLLNTSTSLSAVQRSTVNIAPVNDTPVLSVNSRFVTFTNANGLSIPDNATTSQTLNVSGVSGSVGALTVTVSGLTSFFAGQLDFLLVAPDGVHNLEFMSDAGSASAITLTFADTATTFLSNFGALNSGTFKPTDYDVTETSANWSGLSPIEINHPGGAGGTSTLTSAFGGLSGADLNGAWTLFVRDDSSPGTTSITGWSLSIAPGYLENGPAIKLAPGLTVSDDSRNLASATVHIANALQGDVLAANVNGTAISASYNAASATLLLSGADSPQHYQQVLDSVTFSASNDNPTQFGGNTSRSIEWQVNDGTPQTGAVFGSGTPYSTGAGPRSVALGDINGDGKRDLVVANFLDTFVSVLTGNGDGTFTNAANVAASATGASFVSMADFNGDGKLDLAVAAAQGSGVSVLLGNGNGTFGAPVSIGGGVNPKSIAIADFNNDGRADVAAANSGSNNLSIMLGNGDGTFAAATSTATGSSPQSVAAGDLNADGVIDLVVANDGGGVSLLLGNGNGTFTAAPSVAAGSHPSFVAMGDLNADGRLDLAVTNNADNTVSVLISTGSGTFAAAQNLAVGAQPNAVAIADYNSDGKLDLAVANSNPALSTMSLLLGNGDGTFAAASSINPGTSGPFYVIAGEVNGSDANPDLVMVNNASTVSVLLNTGTNLSPVQKSSIDITAVNDAPVVMAGRSFTNATGIAIPDNATISQTLNVSGLDGFVTNLSVTLTGLTHTFPADLDFLLVGPANDNLVFMSDTGAGGDVSNLTLTLSDSGDTLLPSGVFTLGGSYRPTDYDASETGANWSGFALPGVEHAPGNGGTASFALSFNGASGVALNGDWTLYVRDDALADLGSISGWSLNITTSLTYVENGAPILLAPTLTLSDVDNLSIASATVSIANVHAGDVLSVNVSGTGITQSYNAAQGKLLLSGVDTTAHYQQVMDSVGFSSTSDDPAAMGLSTKRIIEWQVNDGVTPTAPLLAPAVSYAVGADSPLSVATADLNGDGKLDLVSANDNPGFTHGVSVLLGNGDGTFGAAQVFTMGIGSRAVVLADFNGDGNQDIATANDGDNNVSIRLGTGTGDFGGIQNFAAGAGAAALAVADLNHDGIRDLAVANSTDGNVSVLLGNGAGGFGAASNFAAQAGATSIAIADLNGDGKDDLAVANDSGTVSVLLGNGNGTFGAATHIATGGTALSVAVADFNGDGQQDLAVANFNSPDILVLFGNGNGTFQAPINVSIGHGALSVSVADLNGDGKLDIAAASFDGNVVMRLGNGNGSFQPVASSAIGAVPQSIAFGDFNNRGGLDLAVADGSAGISVLLNTLTSVSTVQRTTVSIDPVNDAPIVANPITNPGAAQINKPFSYTVNANTFNDPDSLAVTYSATLGNGDPLPAWLTFDANTRTFSGTPLAGDLGTLSVNIIAADILNAATPANFAITVLTDHGSIVGTNSADALTGSAGSDELIGGLGNDTLDGGAGNDTVSYFLASSGVSVELYNNTASNDGDGGHDTLISIENITGSSFNDLLFGDNNDNVFTGWAGNDQIFGGGGNDTANYASVASGVLVDLAAQNAQDGELGVDFLSDIESAVGSSFNDVLSGSASNNVLSGGAGNDTLIGLAGNDTLSGGLGGDTVVYSAAASGVSVDLAGLYALDGQGGVDSLIGIENITGSAFNDYLSGSAADNVFKGGAGNDIFVGLAGRDTADMSSAPAGTAADLAAQYALDGQGGTDFLLGIENLVGSAFGDYLSGDAADNVFNGGASSDILVGLAGNDTVDYSSGVSGALVDLASQYGVDGLGGTDFLVSIENVIGTAFNDYLSGTTGDNIFKGGAGSDILVGLAGNDTTDYSGGGTGAIVDLASQYGVDGQGGTDFLVSIENVIGSAFSDYINGSTADNVFQGGAGSDTFVGGAGTDTADYGTATAAVTVNFSSSLANDGQGGTDFLVGIENIVGSAFGDSLIGDANGNFVAGGAGNDFMAGAGGADAFVFYAGSGLDTVTDFSRLQGDKVTLQSNLNGSGITTGAQALAHTFDAGGNAIVDLGGGNSVTLLGVTTASLAASDFVIF